MKRNPFWRSAPYLALMSSMASSMAVQAADPQTEAEQAEENDNAIEEVVVTATRRETNLMETGIAVSAFTKEALEREGISNVKDLSGMAPNLSIAVDTGVSAPVISMRGVRSTNTTEIGDPSVGLHMDGVYSPRPQGAMALMFDVETVEILRGPQGTTFGRNSTVGTINVKSRRPNFEETDGTVAVEYGRWNHQQVKGAMNLPITDTFAIRGAFFGEQRDSYLEGYYDPNQFDQRYIQDKVQNAAELSPEELRTRTQRSWWLGTEGWQSGDNPKELVRADRDDFYNNSNQFAFRLSGLWEPTDDFSWLVSFDRFKDLSAGGVDQASCEDFADREGATCTDIYGTENRYTAIVNVPGKVDMKIDSIRSNMDYAINDEYTLIYNFGFSDQERVQEWDAEQGAIDWDMAMVFDETDYESTSHELQIQYTNDEDLIWIAGYFNFFENNFMNGYWHNAMADVAYWDQPQREVKSEAVFAQSTYTFAEDWHLTTGLRYSSDSKEDIGGRNLSHVPLGWMDRSGLAALPTDQFFDQSGYTVETNNDTKGSWDSLNWRVGLDHDLADGTFLYGYVANGFKSGGIGDVVLRNDGTTVDTSYDPEEVITYELGAKFVLLDGSMNLATNFFYTDYKNQQFAQPATVDFDVTQEFNPETQQFEDTLQPVVIMMTQNAAESEITGLEFEYDWKVSENDRVSGFLTFMQTEITSDFVTLWNYMPDYMFGITFEEATNPTNQLVYTNLKGNELPYAPKYGFTLNYERSHNFSNGGSLKGFVSFHWEDESYLTIWNVDKHIDDMNFAVENPEWVTDKRDAWYNLNATVRYDSPQRDWHAELFMNNVTNEEVKYYGGAMGDVSRGSYSMPQFFGLRAGYNF